MISDTNFFVPAKNVFSTPGNCVAGFAAAGAGVGATAGAWAGGGIGGAGGAAGGTLVAPGVGTIGGGVLGAEAGAAGGALVGGDLAQVPVIWSAASFAIAVTAVAVAQLTMEINAMANGTYPNRMSIKR